MASRLARIVAHLTEAKADYSPASPAYTSGGACPRSGATSGVCPAGGSSSAKTCPYLSKCQVATGGCGVAAARKKPVRVAVTGAAGNLAYSACFMIAQGLMLGPDQPIELRLLDIPAMEKACGGVLLELQDGAYPLLSAIVATSDYKVAFENVDYALLIGAKPRGPGMQRSDLLKANAAIFDGQGKALNAYANRNVKILVVGNPANTNALIGHRSSPDLPSSAWSAMTRLDQNRAQSMLAGKLRCAVSQVRNVVIWGNHSKTQFPDVAHGFIADSPAPGFVTSVRSAVNDCKWLDSKFLEDVQDRGAVIIKAREKSSAASAASAAVDHMRSWALGTAPGEYVSMGVLSDGNPYGIPAGLIYSFPVTCTAGSFAIVGGLKIDDFSAKKLKDTADELIDERKQALGI